jgi:hypothetical protein
MPPCDHQIRHVSVKLGVNASLSTFGEMEQHGKGTADTRIVPYLFSASRQGKYDANDISR